MSQNNVKLKYSSEILCNAKKSNKKTLKKISTNNNNNMSQKNFNGMKIVETEDEEMKMMDLQDQQNAYRRLEKFAEREGKKLIHREQKIVAMDICEAFWMTETLMVSLCAPMQWGKTGVMLELGFQMVTHPVLCIPAKNVIIVTGMADNEWTIQTTGRMLPNFTVFHRGQLKKHNAFLETLENGLIIIDECHFGSDETTGLTQTLRDSGLLNTTALQERNVRILQVSATPDQLLVEAEKWNDETHKFHQKIVPTYPESYISVEKILNDGRIRPTLDLSKPEQVGVLVEEIKKFSDPKYHIIRHASTGKEANGCD